MLVAGDISELAGIIIESVIKFYIVALGADTLICRADYSAAGHQLFHSVRRPACNAGDGEQRSEQILGDAEQFIHKTGIEIDICAHDFFVSAQLGKDLE